MEVHYIEVLFTLYFAVTLHDRAEEYRSLYRGLSCIEVS